MYKTLFGLSSFSVCVGGGGGGPVPMMMVTLTSPRASPTIILEAGGGGGATYPLQFAPHPTKEKNNPPIFFLILF